MVDSLQAAIETLREHLRESKRLLEEERCQNVILKEELRNQLLRDADSGRNRSSAGRERHTTNLSPGGLEGSKRDCRQSPRLVPVG